jgi:hypothetical protein
MANWQNFKMAKWRIGRLANSQIWQNGKLEKMANWRNDKMGIFTRHARCLGLGLGLTLTLELMSAFYERESLIIYVGILCQHFMSAF